MKITFWGVRGSFPNPMSPQELLQRQKALLSEVRQRGLPSEVEEERFLDELPPSLRNTVGGHTSCVELTMSRQTLIFDAGSGLRTLGQALMRGPCARGEGSLKIFISHTHWDHIQGLPYFTPLYVEGNRIDIYSGFSDIKRRLDSQQSSEFFPLPLSAVKADLAFHQLKPDFPFELMVSDGLQLGLRVSTHELQHPGGAYGYRVENGKGVFVYASDSDFTSIDEENTDRHLQFFSDADVLVFDSHFSFKESINLCDWGHASALLGAKLAGLARVRELVLFHFSPDYSDEMLYELLERTRASVCEKFPEKITLATEGLVLDNGKS